MGVDFIAAYNERDYERPLIQASLVNEGDENTHGDLTFVKEYQANPYTEDLFNYWQASTSLTRQVLRRLSGSISGFYGEGDYVTLNITDKLSGVTLGMIYELTKNVKGDFGYRFSHTDSTVNSRDYSKNTVSLGITGEF